MSKQYFAPNGSPIVGTYETLTALANAYEYEDDGTPVYEGDTEVFWDTQETVTRGKSLVYLSEDGEEYTWDELTAQEEDEEGEEA